MNFWHVDTAEELPLNPIICSLKKKKLQRFKIYMSYSWCAPIFKISTGSILKNKSKWRQVYLEVHALVSLFFFETKNFNILSWVIMSNLISFCKKSFGFVCVQINAKITVHQIQQQHNKMSSFQMFTTKCDKSVQRNSKTTIH